MSAEARPVRTALALGGNIGEVVDAFARALAVLEDRAGGRILMRSSLWRTAPWGPVPQPDFLNMAVALETALTAEALLDLCLQLEREAGRARRERWGPRTLDMDVIVYGGRSIRTPALEIPHPRAHARMFVLAPLAEVAGALCATDRRLIGEWTAALAAEPAGDVRRDEEATQRLERALAACAPSKAPPGDPTA